MQDYQNFLNTGQQEKQLKDDVPSVIIVSENDWDETRKLANVLFGMGGGNDVVLSTDQSLPDSLAGNNEYPIYVTLPATELEQFLANLSESFLSRIDDFVFFSGGNSYGNIEDILKDRGKSYWHSWELLAFSEKFLQSTKKNQIKCFIHPGYCRDQMTQVLITGLDITPSFQLNDLSISLGNDANGEDKIAGECAACGKWAGSIASRLERFNIFCRTDFYREWRRRMWERSIYDTALNLVGVIRDEPTTLADVAKYYNEEVGDIVWEFSQLVRGWKAITLMYGFEERMLGIAEARGMSTPCALNDEMFPFIWGNNVYLQSKIFVEYLEYAQRAKGLLQTIELPQRTEKDFESSMRKGNLRADGAV